MDTKTQNPSKITISAHDLVTFVRSNRMFSANKIDVLLKSSSTMDVDGQLACDEG